MKKREDGLSDRESFYLMQVYRGHPASQEVSIWHRVEITSSSIVIKHVNYTDEGLYVLKDDSNREVSYTKMELVGRFSELT